MTALWHGWEDKNCLIELPSSMNSEAVKALMEQLVTWHPEMHKKQKTDIVMALWFAELAARDRVVKVTGGSHQKNPFLTPWDQRQQRSVSLIDAEVQGLWKPIGA
jgi:hypothetical protein